MSPALGRCRRWALVLMCLSRSSPRLNWSDGCLGKCPQLESWFSESILPLLSVARERLAFCRHRVVSSPRQSGSGRLCHMPYLLMVQHRNTGGCRRLVGTPVVTTYGWNRYERVESRELTRNVKEKGFSRKKLGRRCHLISPDKPRSLCLCFQDRNSHP